MPQKAQNTTTLMGQANSISCRTLVTRNHFAGSQNTFWLSCEYFVGTLKDTETIGVKLETSFPSTRTRKVNQVNGESSLLSDPSECSRPTCITNLGAKAYGILGVYGANQEEMDTSMVYWEYSSPLKLRVWEPYVSGGFLVVEPRKYILLAEY